MARNKKTGLNEKQLRFVLEYVREPNATAAAKAAGYSEKTAYQQGHALLKNPEIAAHIDRVLLSAAKEATFDVARVLKEIERLSTITMRDVCRWGLEERTYYFDGDGKVITDPGRWPEAVRTEVVMAPFIEPINSDELSADAAAAVAEVQIGKDGQMKIKLHAKTAAMEMAGRHLGMFKDRLELSADDDLVAQLEAATRRRREHEGEG